MTVVADAGPLIALAKIDGLRTLFGLYPTVFTAEAVFEETVTAGQRVQAPDALALQAEYDGGRLIVEALRGTLEDSTRHLGRGERESIRLARQKRADWLLVDDFEARMSATDVFSSFGAATRVKGTLGIIASAFIEGSASLETAIGLLNSIRARGDIWISAALCQQVEDALQRVAGSAP